MDQIQGSLLEKKTLIAVEFALMKLLIEFDTQKYWILDIESRDK